MKRYLLFGADNPQGGWRDLLGDFDSIEEAKIAVPTSTGEHPAIEARWLDATQPLPDDVAEVLPDIRMIMPVLQLVDGDVMTFWQANQRGLDLTAEGVHDIVNIAGVTPEQRPRLQEEIQRYADAPSSDHVWFSGMPASTWHRAMVGERDLAWMHIVDGHQGVPVGQWDDLVGWTMVEGASSGIIIAGAGDIPPRI
jgi:hypothetical protein